MPFQWLPLTKQKQPLCVLAHNKLVSHNELSDHSVSVVGRSFVFGDAGSLLQANQFHLEGECIEMACGATYRFVDLRDF